MKYVDPNKLGRRMRGWWSEDLPSKVLITANLADGTSYSGWAYHPGQGGNRNMIELPRELMLRKRACGWDGGITSIRLRSAETGKTLPARVEVVDEPGLGLLAYARLHWLSPTTTPAAKGWQE